MHTCCVRSSSSAQLLFRNWTLRCEFDEFEEARATALRASCLLGNLAPAKANLFGFRRQGFGVFPARQMPYSEGIRA